MAYEVLMALHKIFDPEREKGATCFSATPIERMFQAGASFLFTGNGPMFCEWFMRMWGYILYPVP